MIIVYGLLALCVAGLLIGIHWYLWRRLVKDVSAPGSGYRRAGTVAVVVLPLTTVSVMVLSNSEAPFVLTQVVAWPGFFWFALMLYLTLPLLVGEAVRPLLLRWLERRARLRATAASVTGEASTQPEPRSVPGSGSVPETDPESEVAAEAVPQAVPQSVPESAPQSAPEAERELESVGAAGGPGSGGASSMTSGGPAGGAALGTAPPEAVEPPVAQPTQSTQSTQPAPGAPSRRLFVSRTIAVAAGAVAVGTVGIGAYGVLNGPSVKRVTIPLAKLPRSGHGYRIAVVSDIHLGPILGRSHTQRIVDTINGTQPDLVAVVGDLVDGSVADLGRAAEPLAQLNARHGSYFVTGNHDYRSGAEEWVEHVRSLGLRPLLNARDELPAFDLAGVNDLAGEDEGEGPDFERALGDRDPTRASVLLAHQPVQIHDAVDHHVDLQLSGHTHGGQMWPGNFLASLANPTLAGLERYGDTQLYVSRGAGTWGPPVRVGAESDITVVELASRQS